MRSRPSADGSLVRYDSRQARTSSSSGVSWPRNMAAMRSKKAVSVSPPLVESRLKTAHSRRSESGERAAAASAGSRSHQRPGSSSTRRGWSGRRSSSMTISRRRLTGSDPDAEPLHVGIASESTSVGGAGSGAAASTAASAASGSAVPSSPSAARARTLAGRRGAGILGLSSRQRPRPSASSSRIAARTGRAGSRQLRIATSGPRPLPEAGGASADGVAADPRGGCRGTERLGGARGIVGVGGAGRMPEHARSLRRGFGPLLRLGERARPDQAPQVAHPVEADQDLAEQPLEAGRLAARLEHANGQVGHRLLDGGELERAVGSPLRSVRCRPPPRTRRYRGRRVLRAASARAGCCRRHPGAAASAPARGPAAALRSAAAAPGCRRSRRRPPPAPRWLSRYPAATPPSTPATRPPAPVRSSITTTRASGPSAGRTAASERRSTAESQAHSPRGGGW